MWRLLSVFVLFSANLFGQAAITDVAAAGNESYAQKQYVNAIAAYEQIPQADRNARLLNRLGISYHMLNRLKEAETAYQASARVDAKTSEALNNLAALHYSQRKFSDAERQVRRALERNPENLILRLNLRAARYARENAKKARDTAAVVSQSDPLLIDSQTGDFLQVRILMPKEDLENAGLHERRGDSFFARKMYDDAVLEYRKAVVIDRYNASLLNRLGLVYHQSQKLREAEQYYREAVKQNPLYLEALNNIGTLEYSRKSYARAISQYNRALKIRPDSPTILMNLGSCLFAMDRYDEGYNAYQRALELDPKAFERNATAGFGTLIQSSQRSNPTMNFYLAKIFAAKGDADRAISYLYKAVEEGFKEIDLIKTEPAFGILAQDERFLKLMESIVAAASSR
jgi:tetratricopeptide (TPR) repeat protein